MRRRSYVQSVILYHLQDESGDSIPTKIEVNSWVALQPQKRGGHAREAKKHGDYLARVLGFRVCPNESTISAIKVQHAYSRKQLKLNPRDVPVDGACNYLYPSNHEDWVSPSSVLRILCVYHAEIGEASTSPRSHRELLEDSVFFYNAWYYPCRRGGFGQLEAIPLPAFDDPSWLLPDMSTTESFRAKMREDFLSSMKPSTGSKVTHLSWFMPINVMVDLFAISTNIHKTRTLFVFKDLTDDVFASLMDNGWNERIHIGPEEIKCCVDPASVTFKYHIGRSMLYGNYQYHRLRLRDGGIWEPMDQAGPIHIVHILCQMGEWEHELQVVQYWNFTSLRCEIEMALGSATPSKYVLYIVDENLQSIRINRRHEKNWTAGDVLPPRVLKVVPEE